MSRIRPHCSILPQTGKLDALDTRGQVFEGNSGKASSSSQAAFNSVSTSSAYRITGSINGFSTNFVVDTGATFSLLKEDLWHKVKPRGALLELWKGPSLVSVDGTAINVSGLGTLQLIIDGRPFQSQMIVTSSMSTNAILGIDFLESHHCMIDLGKKTLHFPQDNVLIKLESSVGTQANQVGVFIQCSRHRYTSSSKRDGVTLETRSRDWTR